MGNSLTKLDKESRKNLGFNSGLGPLLRIICCLVGGIEGSPDSPFTALINFPEIEG